jgi:NTP pyrophosphatase (non-canonical NTP hydrolase)
MPDSLSDLQARLEQFATARDWQQFHSPKNLASALIVEAAELLEHFQWLTEEQSRQLSEDDKAAVGEEVADVLLYLIQLSSALKIDVIDAAHRKLGLNEIKYPVEKSKSNPTKYDKL